MKIFGMKNIHAFVWWDIKTPYCTYGGGIYGSLKWNMNKNFKWELQFHTWETRNIYYSLWRYMDYCLSK